MVGWVLNTPMYAAEILHGTQRHWDKCENYEFYNRQVSFNKLKRINESFNTKLFMNFVVLVGD